MTAFRPRFIAATVCLAALFSACQPAADKKAVPNDDPHAGIDLPPGHPVVAMPGSDSQGGSATSGHPPVIALDGEGLRLVDAKSGVSRALPFGASDAQLKTVAEKLKGPAKAGRNEECGAGALGYLSWPDGLTLYSLDGLFAGWALDDRSTAPIAGAKTGKAAARLTTVSGIGIGSTRAELLDVYDAKVEQTTLGTEFNAAGLSGILDGNGAKARVTNLWSGVNCVFR